MAEPPDEVQSDGRRLKAIAHPLRARLLAALRAHGPATASGLAHRFSTNTGQTSYHLRVLAEAGLVEEVPGGTARERWWSCVQRAAEVAWVQDRSYAQYLDEVDQYGPEWEAAAGMADWQLHLSATELDGLQREIAKVIQRYVDHRPQPAAAADAQRVQPVQVHVRAFPQRRVDRS